MLEQLLDLVQQQGEEIVIRNPAIPDEQNNAVLGEAGNSILGGLQGALAGGGLSQVLSLLTNRGSSGIKDNGIMDNPVVQEIVQSFSGKLANSYQIDPSQASVLSSSLIPRVLQEFSKKVADPNDKSLDINSVMQSLTGGQAQGINFDNLLQKLQGSGGDIDGDGDTDMQDIIARISGGARENSGSAGLAEMAKGLIH